jgi:hypothetical protein
MSLCVLVFTEEGWLWGLGGAPRSRLESLKLDAALTAKEL